MHSVRPGCDFMHYVIFFQIFHSIVAEASEAAIGKDGNTYLLVVDESNQFSGDQLNSQTFYIDSNSLANGGLIQGMYCFLFLKLKRSSDP